MEVFYSVLIARFRFYGWILQLQVGLLSALLLGEGKGKALSPGCVGLNPVCSFRLSHYWRHC